MRTRTLNAWKGNGAHTIPAISRWKRVTALVKTIHNEHNILHATEEPRGAKRAAGKNVLSRQTGSFAPLKPASTKRGFHEKDGFTRKDSSSPFSTLFLLLLLLLLADPSREGSTRWRSWRRIEETRYPSWDFAFTAFTPREIRPPIWINASRWGWERTSTKIRRCADFWK